MGSGHGVVTFRAPYGGFTVNTFPSTLAIGSCAGVHNPVPVNWTGSNGTFHFRGSVAIGNCRGTQTAYAFGEVSLVSPAFPTPFPGNGSVVILTRTALLTSGAVHTGASTSDDATAFVYVFVEIWDATPRVPVLITSSTTYLLDQSLSASGSFAVLQLPTATTITTPVGFSAGHLYEVQVSLVAKVSVDASGGGTASASLDLGGSNSVTLRAITAA